MSLRSAKQQRQRREISENSIALFRERGFEAVRVHDIAAACALSDATFFNYFSSKDALLGEWAEAGFEDALVAGAGRVAGGALRRVVRQWAAELERRVGEDPLIMAEAWRRVRLADLGAPRAPARGRVVAASAAEALIAQAQAEGQVRSDLQAAALAGLLQVAVAGSLANWLATPASERKGSLRAGLASAADLLLDGFRKRNERVSPSAARASARPRRG